MRQTKKVEGTKIAQAAKDLNVTSVTVRRYISEFNIETATDKNGIKVLPDVAMEELKEVRRLKEDGLTNPQVLEAIEEQRSKPAKKTRAKKEDKDEKPKTRAKAKSKDKDKDKDKDKEKPKSKAKSETTKRRGKAKTQVDEEKEEAPKQTRGRKRSSKVEEEEAEVDEPEEEEASEEQEETKRQPEGRLKHSLTCQTCGKSFEHMNPRLRDCLDCYRSKRKERRRGGDRHKNVIQHPLAQQVVNKMAKEQQNEKERPAFSAPPQQQQAPANFKSQKQVQHNQSVAQPIIGGLKTKVRSYRKAIEETRHITSSLKRRLERPDLPEGDRRWLEQIYAYQLILHQGWRHLSEYRSNTQQQAKKDD